jgi:hypothetical protein
LVDNEVIIPIIAEAAGVSEAVVRKNIYYIVYKVLEIPHEDWLHIVNNHKNRVKQNHKNNLTKANEHQRGMVPQPQKP